MKRILVLIYTLGGMLCAYAQTDTSVVLDEALVLYYNDEKGNTRQASANLTLGARLREHAALDIRSGGPSVLSSLAYRGGNANQIAVLWNEIPLASANNGVMDINLIPSFFVDRASVNGSPSTLLGQGAISGILSLDNAKISDSTRFSGHYHYGSFENAFLGIDLSERITDRWNTRTRFFNKSGVNDYTFPAFGPGNRLDTLENASFRGFGLLHESRFDLDKLSIDAKFWYQEMNRGIAPTMLEHNIYRTQVDKNLRSLVQFNLPLVNSHLNGHISYTYEDLFYGDSLSRLYFNYYTHGVFGKLKYRRSLSKKWMLGAEVEDRYFNTLADSFYEGIRNELAFTFYGKYATPKWDALIATRGSRFLETTSPLLYTALFNRKLAFGQLHFSSSRNYRLPTLNDLFWRPGGNPDLLAEESWRNELGMKLELGNFGFYLDYFFHKIDHQIRWLPSGPLYTAQQSELPTWNRGLNQRLFISDSIGDFEIQFQLGHTYTRSSSERDFMESRAKENQNYVPKHMTNSQLSLGYKLVTLTNILRTVGERSSNDQDLPAYVVWDLRLAVHTDIGFNAFLDINNLTNEFYTPIAFRPMPGRNFNLGINYIIN